MPVVVEIARDLGCLTVAVVTRPFDIEGKKRKAQAEEGVRALRGTVDTLITNSNQRLLRVVDRGTSLRDAFKVADDVLGRAVEGKANLLAMPGLNKLDFADIRTVMSGAGLAVMGVGAAQGTGRGVEATQMAVSSPLLEAVSIDGARGVLLNVTGGHDVTLDVVHDAASIIHEAAHDESHVIFGAVTDDGLRDGLRVTVIATGFYHQSADARAMGPPARGGQDLPGLEGMRKRRRGS